MKKLIYVFLTCMVAFASMGQSCGGNSTPTPTPTPQQRGFAVRTYDQITRPGGQVERLMTARVAFFMKVVRDLPPPATVFDSTEFASRTDADARAVSETGKVPAVWSFLQQSGRCDRLRAMPDVEIREAGAEYGFTCRYTSTRPSFNAAPNSMNLNSLPPTFEINGDGISAQYGMPKVSYYNEYGYLIGETRATSVEDDGTWLTANTPNLSQVYTRDYTVVISNAMQDGSFEIIGLTSVFLWGRDEPPYDPPGPEEPCYSHPGTPPMECPAY